jgi:gamma-glutamylcyclotransferase (GGCT)/AIG2-like uncharacterized protein YtfP
LQRGFSRHVFLQAAHAFLISRGTVHTKLFDLGEFPGAIPASEQSGRVLGEIYRLPNPGRVLRLLDQIEAFGPVSPSTSLFRRALAEATLENRATVQASVYWSNRWRGPRRRIASGSFAGKCKQ